SQSHSRYPHAVELKKNSRGRFETGGDGTAPPLATTSTRNDDVALTMETAANGNLIHAASWAWEIEWDTQRLGRTSLHIVKSGREARKGSPTPLPDGSTGAYLRSHAPAGLPGLFVKVAYRPSRSTIIHRSHGSRSCQA